MGESGQAEGPKPGRLRRGAGRLWQVTENAFPAFFHHRCPQLGASISFYALFSVFPMAIVLTAVFGLVIGGDARDAVVDFIVERLPLQEAGTTDLRSTLESVAANAGTVGAIGLVGVLYSASALMGAVRNSLNAIWDFDERRPPLRGKALDILLVFGLGTLFALSLTIALLAGVAEGVGRQIGIPETLIAGTFSFVSFAVPILLSAAVFTIALRYVPARRQPWRDIWPGVLVATAGYQLAQVGFAFYLGNFARYSAIYGSLGAIIAFMVFVYLAAMIFLLGAQYARLWPAARAGELEGDDDGEPFGRQLVDFLKGLVVDDRSKDR